MLDALAASQDEETLHLFVDRLPNEDLRTEARRRIVRLHIAASPFPEVQAHADDVEERVLIRGANVLATNEQPATRGWLDETRVPMRGVLVRQDLWAQTATLLGYRDREPRLSIRRLVWPPPTSSSTTPLRISTRAAFFASSIASR